MKLIDCFMYFNEKDIAYNPGLIGKPLYGIFPKPVRLPKDSRGKQSWLTGEIQVV